MWSLGLLVDGCSAWLGSFCNCWFDFVWSAIVVWVVFGCSVVGIFSSFSGFVVSACFWVFWFIGDEPVLDVGGMIS